MDVWFVSSNHVETLHDGSMVGPGEDALTADPERDRKLIERGALSKRPKGTHTHGIDATDAAVELAREHDIDLLEVAGTGKDGRIKESDVKTYIDAQEASAPPENPSAAPDPGTHEPAESQEKED